MAEDPRRAVVEVIGRLGRETQLHLDERYRHFRITDGVIMAISLLLVVLAVFNVYYVHVLYKDLDGILGNMESMYEHLRGLDEDMTVITGRIESFDAHMGHMESIHDHMASLSEVLPHIQDHMHQMSGDMNTVEQSMGLLSQGMTVIDQRVHLMTGGVGTMRSNMGQMTRPMGGMTPFMP